MKRIIIAIGLLSVLTTAAIAQSLWGNAFLNAVFSGTITGTYTLAGTPTLQGATLTGTTALGALSGTASGTYTLGGTPSVGAGGTGLTNGIVIYSQSLTPTITSAAIQTVEQTFTVTGIATGDTLFLNGPAPTSLCPPVHVRASNTNTVAIAFSVLTAAACTPASGTYKIIAIR